MKKVELPLVGTAMGAATYIFDMSRELQDTVETDFNGTPMSAHLSDVCPDMIMQRWHYERLLIQIANGIVNVRRYVDHRYLRQK